MDTTIWQLLDQAGWTMYPIYACSVFGIVIAVRKALDFRAVKLRDLSWLEGVVSELRAGDPVRAADVARRAVHPASLAAVGLLRALQEQPAHAEAEAQRIGLEQVARLEHNLRPLALVAEIAPLLGLLGTVVGMVDLFQGISGQAQGSVAMAALSGGIWKALLTTAAGLTVAVPALALHAYFASRVGRFRVQLTSVVQRVTYAFAAGVEDS